MVRFGAFVCMSLCMSGYTLWYLKVLNIKFNRLISLTRFLFEGRVDPTVLDG